MLSASSFFDVTRYVLPLVHLTALNNGQITESLIDGRTQALAPVHDHQQPVLKREATLNDVFQEALDRRRVFAYALRDRQ